MFDYLKNNIKTTMGAKKLIKIKRTTFTGTMKLKITPEFPGLSLSYHFDANLSILWYILWCILNVYLLCILLCDKLQKIRVFHALVSFLDPKKHSHVGFRSRLSRTFSRLSRTWRMAITQADDIQKNPCFEVLVQSDPISIY